jgi:DNA (cytosine-5)-methyltransferase 1
MENVPGMLTIEGENVAVAIQENFSSIGYRCSLATANALWFGVPQDRSRLIFIGTRRDIRPEADASLLSEFADHFRNGIVGLTTVQNVRQAIGDLPAILHGHAEDPTLYDRRGRITPYAGLMRENCSSLVTDHISRWHNAQDLAAFRYMIEGMKYHQLPRRFKRYRDDIFLDKYKRLVWNRPAWTVTAHFAKDVYTHIHPDQARTVSIREAARLQSFPDSFRFAGNMGDRFRLIGNAVPPLMSWGIAEYIRGHLEAANAW